MAGLFFYPGRFFVTPAGLFFTLAGMFFTLAGFFIYPGRHVFYPGRFFLFTLAGMVFTLAGFFIYPGRYGEQHVSKSDGEQEHRDSPLWWAQFAWPWHQILYTVYMVLVQILSINAL